MWSLTEEQIDKICTMTAFLSNSWLFCTTAKPQDPPISANTEKSSRTASSLHFITFPR